MSENTEKPQILLNSEDVSFEFGTESSKHTKVFKNIQNLKNFQHEPKIVEEIPFHEDVNPMAQSNDLANHQFGSSSHQLSSNKKMNSYDSRSTANFKVENYDDLLSQNLYNRMSDFSSNLTCKLSLKFHIINY